MFEEMASDATMSASMSSAKNYHDWVFSSYADQLKPGLTLEVGAGHGAHSKLIAPRVSKLLVSDLDPDAVERMEDALSDVSNVQCLVMKGVDSERIKRDFGKLDNLILTNLLEHIEDDNAMLRDCADVLEDGGRLMLFVPAFPLLYSRMDEEAGHYRRYRRKELEARVKEAGLDVLESRYFNAVGFFGWLGNRISRSSLNSASTNWQVTLYDRLIPRLRVVDRLLPMVGQSLVLVAERRN